MILKAMFKNILMVLVLFLVSSNILLAEVTGNFGFNSEYYYRGILQKNSSTNGGIDFETGNISGGIWAADVGDGLEYDIYSSYEHNWQNGISTSIGFTGYFYTGEFDDTYKELNLGFGYQWISLEYSSGTWDGGNSTGDDYQFIAITIERNNFYGKYGSFSDEFDGDYWEFGYNKEIGGFDASIALILSSSELSDQLDSNGLPTESEALIFSLSKSFEL